MIRRRDVITLLAGAAAARAQQPALPTIEFLSSRSPDEAKESAAAFRSGLRTKGYVDGQNVAIEYRWAEADYGRLPGLAADLVRGDVAVLVATGGEPSALAAKAATSTIPIVFTVGGDAERLIGSIRRECVDHVVVLGEAHLRRILAKYATYYNELRTHRFSQQERSDPSRHPARRPHRISPHPRRTSSPLLPNLIFGTDNRERSSSCKLPRQCPARAMPHGRRAS